MLSRTIVSDEVADAGPGRSPMWSSTAAASTGGGAGDARPAMSGALPCTASKMAAVVPMLAPGAAEPADQARHLVAQDVAEHVGRHHDVELLGAHHQLHGRVVDDHVGRLHPSLVLPRDAASHFQEEPAHHLEDVRLVDDRDLLPAVAERVLERVAHDALAARAGDDRHRFGHGARIVPRPGRSARRRCRDPRGSRARARCPRSRTGLPARWCARAARWRTARTPSGARRSRSGSRCPRAW